MPPRELNVGPYGRIQEKFYAHNPHIQRNKFSIAWGAEVDDHHCVLHQPDGTWLLYFSERGNKYDPAIFESDQALIQRLLSYNMPEGTPYPYYGTVSDEYWNDLRAEPCCTTADVESVYYRMRNYKLCKNTVFVIAFAAYYAIQPPEGQQIIEEWFIENIPNANQHDVGLTISLAGRLKLKKCLPALFGCFEARTKSKEYQVTQSDAARAITEILETDTSTKT